MNDDDRSRLWDTYAEHQLAVRCPQVGWCVGCEHQELHVATAGCLHDVCCVETDGGPCVPPGIVVVGKESPC